MATERGAPGPMKSYDDYDDDYGAGPQRKSNNGKVAARSAVDSAPRPVGTRDTADVAYGGAYSSSGSAPNSARGTGIMPSPRPRTDAPTAALGIKARLSRPDSATQLAESSAPHNSLFVTPIFPQLPITVTGSCSSWAIMLEQACQTLEGIFGPLLEAVLCECTSTGLIPADKGHLAPPLRSPRVVVNANVAAAVAAAAASCATGSVSPAGAPGARPPGEASKAGDSQGRLSGSGFPGDVPSAAELPQPPYDAATCLDLLLRHDWLSYNKFPVTIRKRLEAASVGVNQLHKEPDALTGSVVLTSEQAMKSIIQDCLKAMSLPSLLGGGSRQFMAFVRQVRPEFESQLLYFEVLVEDCQAAMQAAEAQEQAAQAAAP